MRVQEEQEGGGRKSRVYAGDERERRERCAWRTGGAKKGVVWAYLQASIRHRCRCIKIKIHLHHIHVHFTRPFDFLLRHLGHLVGVVGVVWLLGFCQFIVASFPLAWFNRGAFLDTTPSLLLLQRAALGTTLSLKPGPSLHTALTLQRVRPVLFDRGFWGVGGNLCSQTRVDISGLTIVVRRRVCCKGSGRSSFTEASGV